MKLLLILFSTANALIDSPSIVGSKAFERSSGDAFVANGSALVGSDKAALTSDNLTTSQKQKVSSLLNGLEVALGSYNLLGDSATALDVTVDLQSLHVSTITTSIPLLPGDGVGNGLLWNIDGGDAGGAFLDGSGGEVTTHGAPQTPQEWEQLATSALQSWMSLHADILEIDVGELFGPVDGESIAGSDYTSGSTADGTEAAFIDESKSSKTRTAIHNNGDTIQFHLPRTYRNLPVLGSRAMATIKLGNLVNIGFEEWGPIEDLNTEPTLTVDEAYQTLAREVDLTLVPGEKCTPSLNVLTISSSNIGSGYSHALVYKICPIFEGQDIEVMEGLVDAHTGEVYSFVDKVHYLTSSGGVFPKSNDGRVPDGLERSGWPMPYMYVGNELTDTGGNYWTDGSASFHGEYVLINDRCGTSALAGALDWGASSGTDCTTPGHGGAGNTHSARTNFYEVNKVMEMARSHLPNNAWLKQKLKVNVNINDSCNAWWMNTINFYRRGNGCGNTGELVGVIVHEWGHGLDDNDVTGSIASPSGEGIADIYAALRMGDSCIGRGFFLTGASCTGVRNIDYVTGSGRPKTFSNNGCNGAVHCLGGVYSEAVWSLYKRFLQSEPYNYDDNTALEIVTRLTFIAAGNVGTWFSGSAPWGGCGSASGYREYLAADDDNGNINDGTPHMQAIYNAFNEHEIACATPTPFDSGCSGTPNVAPHVTVTPGNMKAIISWSVVSGATNYQVFRTEGIKCEQGKVKLTTTTNLSFVDTGLMNGREYYYIVIAKGPNESCFGPSSFCTTVIPSDAPVPTTPSPTKKPVMPTKSPTTQPTKQCGNGKCEIDEGSAMCPADCSNRQLSLLTDATKGAPGIMFWVEANSRDIDVSAFQFFTWTTTSNLIQIYTRSGKYTGFELNEDGWRLVYEESVQLKGSNAMTELTLANKVSVPAGTTQSFLLWINGGNLKYEAGTTEGALLDSDGFVNFYEGVGLTSKLSGTSTNVYRPRRFSGIISYDVLSSMTLTVPPTAKPVTEKPSKLPTKSPSKKPSKLPTKSPSKKPTNLPSAAPTTASPTLHPSKLPTKSPSKKPTPLPSAAPTTASPTLRPSNSPTVSPSAKCGNDTCEADESSTSCPQDCSNIILTAHDDGKSGAPGIMFDVTASRDVLVRSFEFYTDATRNDVVEVYTRPGNYSGHEVDQSGWSLVYSKSVNQKGRTILTKLGDFNTAVHIQKGSTQSFFIVTNYFLMYDTGTAEGQILSSDDSLIVYEGVGIASKFPGAGTTGKVYSPRLFKGNIRYDAISVTSSPTKAPQTLRPTNVPSNSPVSGAPTKQPSKMPLTSAPTNNPTQGPTTIKPTHLPSKAPTAMPTDQPSTKPTLEPITPTGSCYPLGRTIRIEATTNDRLNMFEVHVFSSGKNVAEEGTATQSDTFRTFEASRAIDHDLNTFSHTARATDTLDWWQLEFEQAIGIESIEIVNRWCQGDSDPLGCLCRLSNANLSILDDDGSVIVTQSTGNTCGSDKVDFSFQPSFDCNLPSKTTQVPTASPMAIRLPNIKHIRLHAVTRNPIQMFEVEIYSSGLNVAIGKNATQSSTLKLMTASNAVDGSNTTFSHTTSESTFSWWEVDLGEAFPVESVTIWNRYCKSPSDPNGCLCRLSHAVMSFFDENGSWVATASVGDTCGQLSWTHSFGDNSAVCTWLDLD